MNPKKSQDSGYGLSDRRKAGHACKDRRSTWSLLYSLKQPTNRFHPAAYQMESQRNERRNRVKRDETQGFNVLYHEIHAKLSKA